jgi:SAM-dependent methyltransferase
VSANADILASRTTALWQFSWRWLPGDEAIQDEQLLAGCTALYSGHYGIWGDRGPHPGEHIHMSASRLREALSSSDTWLACAYHFDRLIGYCAAVRAEVPDRGRIVWVTQLVVDSSFRQASVGTTLLFGVWQFSDCYAWGLATPNPYAVRALETATRRPCRLSVIKELGPEILQALAQRVAYLPDTLYTDTEGRLLPIIDTRFFVDLAGIEDMREAAARSNRPWQLGMIGEGQEWFACTFASQPPTAIDNERLVRLLEGADEIWIHAYEGMTLDEDHLWRQHTDAEVQHAIAATGLPSGSTVLDVGCGDGRHAEAFAALGYLVTGIDISKPLIERGRERIGDAVVLEQRDARMSVPDGPFDMALCLYDVLGSSANGDEDVALLRNIFDSLVPGGSIVASVMNTNVTLNRLSAGHHPETIDAFVAALESLPPSDRMERTGLIFEPAHLLLFDGIYYRKEQFDKARTRLPSELVVRDKRYGKEEIMQAFLNVGYTDVNVRPVQVGHWGEPLEESDERAKELLVLARRPADDPSS